MRSVYKPQHCAAEYYAGSHKYHAQRAACNKRCRHGCFHVPIAFCAEQLGYYNGAAYVAAKCKGKEYKRYLIAVANRGKRIFANKFAGDKAVRYVIELLKYYAAEQRQAKAPQHLGRFSYGKVVVHSKMPLIAYALVVICRHSQPAYYTPYAL